MLLIFSRSWLDMVRMVRSWMDMSKWAMSPAEILPVMLVFVYMIIYVCQSLLLYSWISHSKQNECRIGMFTLIYNGYNCTITTIIIIITIIMIIIIINLRSKPSTCELAMVDGGVLAHLDKQLKCCSPLPGSFAGCNG